MLKCVNNNGDDSCLLKVLMGVVFVGFCGIVVNIWKMKKRKLKCYYVFN